MITAKQKIITYLNETGLFPDLQTWLNWGYSEKYYYQVKKQVLNKDSDAK